MKMAPTLKAKLYLARRERAIKLFTHYPVLNVKIKQGVRITLTLLTLNLTLTPTLT